MSPTPTTVGRSHRRNGHAITELAVCLPVIVTILLATIEACVMLQLKQNLAITAYEGARIGVLPGSTHALVQAQCQLLLDDRKIQKHSVSISPDPSNLSVGDLLTVSVSADCTANSVVGALFFEGRSITESVVMKAE